LIITPILVLGVYHLQKPRPKLKIVYTESGMSPNSDFFDITFLVQNIGYTVAEDLTCKISADNKEVDNSPPENYSQDMRSFQEYRPSIRFPLKQGEECKIKIEISWGNHTCLLKKRDKLTQEFTCKRIDDQNVRFEKC